MTTKTKRTRKPKHPISALPWEVVLIERAGFDDGRDRYGIGDAEDGLVADWLYREDAETIVKAMNASGGVT